MYLGCLFFRPFANFYKDATNAKNKMFKLLKNIFKGLTDRRITNQVKCYSKLSVVVRTLICYRQIIEIKIKSRTY